MGSVSPAQVSDGTTIDASDVNNPINTIANEFNGNIDNTNIKAAAAITGSKLADNSIDMTTKASSWDGWVQVTDTWTYASSTTVTVPSDATTKYSVGDKVKFTNSGSKYYYITAVSATVLTLNGGTDYTVANAAISAIYYSKAATPLSFPQWFAFSPTLTNVTEGSGTKAARFTILGGKTLITKGSFTLGAGSSIGGVVAVSYPVTISGTGINSEGHVGYGTATDSGNAVYPINCYNAGTTTFQLVAHNKSAGGNYTVTNGGSDRVTTTIPFTFGSGDSFGWTSIAEIA